MSPSNPEFRGGAPRTTPSSLVPSAGRTSAPEPGLDRRSRQLIRGLIGGGIVSALHLNLGYGIHVDELEHLHDTWLWMQGVQPYTQFFEHHPPLYWLVLRPVFWCVQDRNLYQLAVTVRSWNG
ncbi:MAG: hypothetical protein HY718_14110 [Planctomycetes bacterium]|nr:hypothetical protein [Planctomycetota bacterium]